MCNMQQSMQLSVTTTGAVARAEGKRKGSQGCRHFSSGGSSSRGSLAAPQLPSLSAPTFFYLLPISYCLLLMPSCSSYLLLVPPSLALTAPLASFCCQLLLPSPLTFCFCLLLLPPLLAFSSSLLLRPSALTFFSSLHSLLPIFFSPSLSCLPLSSVTFFYLVSPLVLAPRHHLLFQLLPPFFASIPSSPVSSFKLSLPLLSLSSFLSPLLPLVLLLLPSFQPHCRRQCVCNNCCSSFAVKPRDKQTDRQTAR